MHGTRLGVEKCILSSSFEVSKKAQCMKICCRELDLASYMTMRTSSVHKSWHFADSLYGTIASLITFAVLIEYNVHSK